MKHFFKELNLQAFVVFFVFLFATDAVGSYAIAEGADGLFQSKEIKSTNMTAFSKWTTLWRRYNLPRKSDQNVSQAQTQSGAGDCSVAIKVDCRRAAWEEFIASAHSLDSIDKLSRVNLYLNQQPYIVDPVNWGLPDYWATPDEFFMKDGDCEDYAISKYVTLKRLGISAENMRLVVVQDENLNTPHAVLAVNIDGKEYILDNQINQVVPHDQILHYRPVYSINEEAWWLHQKSRFGR